MEVKRGNSPLRFTRVLVAGMNKQRSVNGERGQLKCLGLIQSVNCAVVLGSELSYPCLPVLTSVKVGQFQLED